MEAAAIPASPSSPRLFAGTKARRAAKRAARLSSDAERFERAAVRLEAAVGADAWQVRHLYRQGGGPARAGLGRGRDARPRGLAEAENPPHVIARRLARHDDVDLFAVVARRHDHGSLALAALVDRHGVDREVTALQERRVLRVRARLARLLAGRERVAAAVDLGEVLRRAREAVELDVAVAEARLGV